MSQPLKSCSAAIHTHAHAHMCTYTQCSWTTLTAQTTNPFGNAPSVGGQAAGSVPFGSGSLTCCCTNNGAGDGNTFGGAGMHCLDNINDDVEGNANSWIMSNVVYNGKSFAGVRFPGRRKIRGIRISRDAIGAENDRYSRSIYVYITRPDTVPSPTYTTSPTLWECVGIIPPRTSKTYFWYEFPTVVEASGIILEPEAANQDSGQWAGVDELKVYARVSKCWFVRVSQCMHMVTLVECMFARTLSNLSLCPAHWGSIPMEHRQACSCLSVAQHSNVYP